MRCSSVLPLIDDHVDGLLPAEKAEQVRNHLDDCRDCRDTALAAKAASTSLTAWGDLEPPEACFDSIWQQIRTLPPDALDRPARAHRDRWQVSSLSRFALPLATAAVVIAGFVMTEPRGLASPLMRTGARPPVGLVAMTTAAPAPRV